MRPVSPRLAIAGPVGLGRALNVHPCMPWVLHTVIIAAQAHDVEDISWVHQLTCSGQFPQVILADATDGYCKFGLGTFGTGRRVAARALVQGPAFPHPAHRTAHQLVSLVAFAAGCAAAILSWTPHRAVISPPPLKPLRRLPSSRLKPAGVGPGGCYPPPFPGPSSRAHAHPHSKR